MSYKQLLCGFFISPASGYPGGVKVNSVWLGTDEELDKHFDRAIAHVQRCGFIVPVLDVNPEPFDFEKTIKMRDDIKKRVMAQYLEQYPELRAEHDDNYYKAYMGE